MARVSSMRSSNSPFAPARGKLRRLSPREPCKAQDLSPTPQDPSSYASSSGVASSRLRVYACAGRLVICSVSPTSTIFPRYITAIRVER
jgi:hypothetical protein